MLFPVQSSRISSLIKPVGYITIVYTKIFIGSMKVGHRNLINVHNTFPFNFVKGADNLNLSKIIYIVKKKKKNVFNVCQCHVVSVATTRRTKGHDSK